MEETGPTPADLRYALLRIASGDRDVDPAIVAELAARGYFTGELGSARLTPSGRTFGLARASRDVRSFMIEILRLDRIVPGGQERRTQSGSRVVVTAVELWSNETVIRWTIIGDGSPDLVHGAGRYTDSSLEDDVGTRYAAIHSGGGGDNYVTHRYDRFAGAVPQDARSLAFTPQDMSTMTVTPDAVEPMNSILIRLS